MKQKLLFALLFFSVFASAQIVNIPDANFKNKLLQSTATNGTAKDINGVSIVVDSNGDGQIQQTEAQAVYTLYLSYAGITNMNGIQSFTNLTNLTCNNNSALTSLDISGMFNLTDVRAEYNALTTLNLSGCTGLVNLKCWDNALTSLDLGGLTNLNLLYCTDNQLTQLDLSTVNLTDLVAGDNLFTTLDLSTQTQLEYFNIYGCPNLYSVYLKNGHVDPFDGETFGGCYNLNYICLDEGEYESAYNSIAILAQYPNEPIIENITFSTICSVNGEQNNSITGTVHFDGNANGCDSIDPASPLVKVTSLHNGSTSSIWTTPSGYYSFIAETGDYQLSLDLQGLQYFAADGTAAPLIGFSALNGTVTNQDFCIVPVGEHNDLEVTVSHNGAVLAGGNPRYWLTYKNSGNQVLDGSISFSYNDDVLSFSSATTAYTTAATGLVTWNFSALQPFESRTIIITLHANTATSTPPLLLGDTLGFSFAGTIAGADETPENNQLDLTQIVASSMDPNNIICLEGATVPTEKIGEYLHYTINFENIGTAAADFVIVTNEIDADKYDISSVEVLHSSHSVAASQEGNLLTFRFDDIALAPQAYGSVSFKIKSLATLEEGDAVMSQASIIFDYNEPLVTNEAVTTFDDVAGTGLFGAENLSIYPNPASDKVSIKAGSIIKTISLYDIQGRLLLTKQPESQEAAIDISAQPAGVYLLRIATDTGSVTQKLIKK